MLILYCSERGVIKKRKVRKYKSQLVPERRTLLLYAWVSIWEYIIIDMKYFCKSCKAVCKDITEHLRKVHNFSKATIKSDLERKPDTYKNAFEEIK